MFIFVTQVSVSMPLLAKENLFIYLFIYYILYVEYISQKYTYNLRRTTKIMNKKHL